MSQNICQFENQADTFQDEINVDDGRYQAIRSVVYQYMLEHKECNILDIGCGKGRYLKNLVREFDKNMYYAVDLSINVMKHFQELSIQKEQGNLTNIPYSDNQFDICYSCEALEHAIDIKNAICELARVTKPGGKIIVLDKNKEMYGYCEIEEWEQWFDENELKLIMKEYCSSVEVIKEINYDGNEANGLFYAWVGTVKG